MNWQLKMQETPFGQNTRQVFLPMNQLTFSAGGREQQPIPRVGYLARIHWGLQGTLNVVLGGGTAVLDEFGPWNVFNRVRCIANSGQDIFSTSGYGAFLIDVTRGPRGRNIQEPGTFTNDAAANVFSAPTANGANAWNFGVTLPVALNEESELGLVLLQNEMAQVQFALEYNSLIFSTTPSVAPVVVTGAATATLDSAVIVPTLEYFAVPADPNARPDISILHQVLEFTSGQIITGDNAINLIRENIYVDLMHHVILDNAANGVDVNEWRLVLNQSETPYKFQNRAGFRHQRSRYGMDLPSGVLTYPLFDQGFPGFGDERDLINGRATSELQSIVQIATGATLGSGPHINTITRQLVKLQSPTVRQA